MNFVSSPEDVRCESCKAIPETIIWDFDFDHDGNERVHTYGKYRCQCGDSEVFQTNDPYDDETESTDELPQDSTN